MFVCVSEDRDRIELKPLDVRSARRDGPSRVDDRGRLLWPTLDAGAERKRDCILPAAAEEWHVNAANAGTLARTLAANRAEAYLFRTLATLRTDIPLFDRVEQLRWTGPTERFESMAARLEGR